jgi:HEAT repeat protein
LTRDVLAFHKTRLEKLVAALTRPGELWRALVVLERPGHNVGAGADIHQQAAKKVADRLKEALTEALQKGDPVERLAAVTLLGEMGMAAEKPPDLGMPLGMPAPGGPRRSQLLPAELAPALLDRLKTEEESDVRAAMARALGKISTDPKPAAAVLEKLLTCRDVAEQRAAAGALGELMRRVVFFVRSRRGSPDEVSWPKLTVEHMVPVAGRGAHAEDPEVRRLCRAALLEAARGLTEFVPPPENPDFYPPADGPMTKEEQEALIKDRHRVEELWRRVGPWALVLDEQAAALARFLEKDDAEGCLSACKFLEALGDARRKLWAVDASVRPVPGSASKPLDELLPRLVKGETVTAVAKSLGHKDVRVRLGAIYVLESLETAAAPAVGAVVKATTDENPFVRWGAARVLGRMAPRETSAVVPALAKLLKDENRDVFVTALAALERYGPNAKDAVPALGEVVKGDADASLRLAAIQALLAVGTDARKASGELRDALAAADAPVRAAAARALGRLGAPEPATKDALRKALADSDATVREAASEALLRGSGSKP